MDKGEEGRYLIIIETSVVGANHSLLAYWSPSLLQVITPFEKYQIILLGDRGTMFLNLPNVTALTNQHSSL